ncbi:MAG: 2-oxoglutarate dehydrogenase E1 component [Proteobacteria bacterium]|nr:2-oxoglutarate dehydrogenase E1 component [Pseudomonadota bacterium]MBI3499207.1 2-oxoglutarate dehydrogenase E1 component [Pseudomonadota bacterium]
MAAPSEPTFLNGANAPFIAELYYRYLENPGAVDPSWQEFFRGLSDEKGAVEGDLQGASWRPRTERIINGRAQQEAGVIGAGASEAEIRRAALDTVRGRLIVRAHRERGHFLANLDPLGLEKPTPHPELEPSTYGFGPEDMDRRIFIGGPLGIEVGTVAEIFAAGRATYCGHVGVEYMHITDPARRNWIQDRIEGERNHTDFTSRGKRAILERLTAAEMFEKFLGIKYVGTKRFGLDGAESLIPALEQILKRGSQLGLREVVLGMPHRGRLNVLTNFMKKPFKALFSEFQGNPATPEEVQGSGDVKYHLGTSSDREFDGNTVHLSLTANPSHLEAVNPVVEGKVRAKQQQLGDSERKAVMPLLMHGDAAFAGQGLVPETIGLSELRGYKTGGTMHFIVNNQIGFTTSPRFSRSSPYPSDVAKMVDAPILHVNGDDPESVVHVARIATEYRQQFGSDVVIDMFCYRRFGHNEGDEPSFTQPLMYRAIAGHPTTREIYAKRLVDEGTMTQEEADKMSADFRHSLELEFEAATSYKPNKADWLEGKWAGFEVASGDERRGETAVKIETLKEIGSKLAHYPEGFHIHPKLVRQLEAKRRMFETGEGIDWATGEALAFGALLIEGNPVRLSGQDSGRGTFSQRHAILVDQVTEDRYVPLADLKPDQAKFEVIDSPLSEAGVLGFEYGYTLAEPNALVLWEAQFGDFANGAQMIIDQFIACGEIKWLRMSGLVMLLPHGYEGAGPEHSSARLERYLQLCGEDNMQVVNITTPANYFHALRRQLRRAFRKPLIVMAPKSLLRHKLAVSKLAEMQTGTTFHRVLWDDAQQLPDEKIKRVVLCSGKIYFDLFEERAKRGIKDVYLMRVEQLYPFPFNVMAKELKRFPKAEIVWCQEEPQNTGAWNFIDRRIEESMATAGSKSKRVRYVGRPEAAATATGLLRRHNREQAKIVGEALTVD